MRSSNINYVIFLFYFHFFFVLRTCLQCCIYMKTTVRAQLFGKCLIYMEPAVIIIIARDIPVFPSALGIQILAEELDCMILCL
jgi:hypothetical protein